MMRLTCPNCGAQYEVPDEVIPPAGRDVQCSNCGDTWYQHHPDHPAEEHEADEVETHPGWDSPSDETDPESEAEVAQETDEQPEIEEESEAEPVSEASEDVDEDTVWEYEEEAEEDIQTPPRRELDPAIADVLRQEATREEEARAAEGGGLETQPDLGLGEVGAEDDQRSKQAKARMARLRGLPEDAAPDAAPIEEPDPGSRRNLLPDIDEINSSLNSESSRAELAASDHEDGSDVEMVARQKGGFRRGFTTSVLIFVLLALLYVFAPMLAEKIPALSGFLTVYVDAVNGLRTWLSSLIAS